MTRIIENNIGDMALTFDDVLLRPEFSDVLPGDIDISTQIAKDFKLNLPIISAAMDQVTDSRLAIAMAQAGGLGVIHRNLSPCEQVSQVHQVKKFESGMVVNPVTISPCSTLEDALFLMKNNSISGIPVVESNTCYPGKLVGILTNRDVRFASDTQQRVGELMTRDLITVKKEISLEEAKALLHKYRIEKLLVVDDDNCCIGLITVKDIERSRLNPHATKDSKGRLRVAAAVSVGKDIEDRVGPLVDVGVDLLVVDTAHGHSQKVLDAVKKIKKNFPSVLVMAGNVATSEGALALIDAGSDIIKVGIGPGSICTTRVVTGVGCPQLSAIMSAVAVAERAGVAVIADGGIRFSGDIAKAIAAGSAAVMIGSLLAGTDESPGDIFLYQGRSFKSYRGMGSVAAMVHGSAARYSQDGVTDVLKLVPEGIEARVPYKGPVASVLHQMAGGLKSSMGYVGAADIKKFQKKANFIRISAAGVRESHVHDVKITRESPNYFETV
ncbi:inosine-5-monophosphate dehydrogenase [Candidatus Liberibacter solanacearum]|uniref:Inosine-5'-monophosphate dehydrogenase n=1 Tax=Candidatus Liberibacter solanacearum TaxID=556287 RepID=A0A095BEE3_9HYPH|nr:IMP dehydrogenase [Candidatus Liberibacter solanacearum]KGB27183.1 inosine-5-monophosphate dehydrogenase [Candidatus Liberibacter solanacearum]KJZ81313.1 Inosine-5'-monophosphate dehydrogenase [Candidatus Liberibacter solanacearum]KQC48718.1 inosine-5'-monophosphate dehydrogenase [Candidatus Liberibacter solanacearum]ONI58763.1 IMP dehydrogenase [Candidatus Liberibacter solanacearum]ONI59412.1 IMP dehydrogenase [Candidatus Liberibacter solanacearum]